jgi:predicted nucleotidyltransferase
MNDFRTICTSDRKAIVQKIISILEVRHEIIFAYVHGSFTQDIPFRDLDIAMYLDEKRLSTYNELDYEEGLSEMLSADVRVIVDVRVLNRSPLGFLYSVFKNGCLLFSRDEVLGCDLIENVSLEYADFYEYSLQYLEEIVN